MLNSKNSKNQKYDNQKNMPYKDKILNEIYDTNYDHYYDDVKVIDEKKIEKEIDIELIKKLAAVIGGFLVVMGICALLIKSSGGFNL